MNRLKIGIVGHEETKFTPSGKAMACEAITLLLSNPNTMLVSGGCHLGGVDIWAETIANVLGKEKHIFLPVSRQWSPGYKERNIQIAKDCDHLICIAVARLADSYQGMEFDLCYHCKKTDHVKGGGCWTMKYAKSLGKHTQLLIIPNLE